MHFEDYNYDLFNKYVLIDPNKGVESSWSEGENDDEDAHESSKSSEMVGFSLPKAYGGKAQEDKVHELNEKNIEISVKENYEHEMLSVKTGEEQQKEEEERLRLKR